MYKWTGLFLLLIAAMTAHAQSYSAADAVLSGGDTVLASFHQADTTIGDTVYFGMDGDTQKGLYHFFQKRLHAPRAGDSTVTGTARIYFVIDKTGRVTQAWYNASDNVDIGLSVLSVVNQLPPIRPTSIKGEAVITKVVLKVVMDSQTSPYAGEFKADLTSTAGPTMH
jgi:hypothetical protein